MSLDWLTSSTFSFDGKNEKKYFQTDFSWWPLSFPPFLPCSFSVIFFLVFFFSSSSDNDQFPFPPFLDHSSSLHRITSSKLESSINLDYSFRLIAFLLLLSLPSPLFLPTLLVWNFSLMKRSNWRKKWKRMIIRMSINRMKIFFENWWRERERERTCER